MAMDFAPVADLEYLTPEDIRTFTMIAEGDKVPDALEASVVRLIAWGFVVIDPDHDRLVALNPETVARQRVEAELKAAARRIQRMSSLPNLTEQLAVPYAKAQWRSRGDAEYIDDPAIVNARLEEVVGSAEREILAAHPGGPRTRENVDGAIARDTAALDRGVELRTLYLATVREDAMTAEYARMMATRTDGRAAEYRTLPEPFERCIVVDRKVAFVSNHLVEDAPAHAAWQINCRASVAHIAEEFEGKWRRGNPWLGELRGRGLTVDTVTGPSGVRTSRRQREIVRDMIEGKEQRATALRLGISVRTVSDEINTVKELFGAKSREQLAYKWAWCADRLVDDSAPAARPAGAEHTAA